jgi:nucleotide-binding universal stress UspA family protein
MPSVIVAYDGSELAHRALEHASDLVGPGGTVSVINVIRVQSVSSRLENVSEQQRAVQNHLLLEAESFLAGRRVTADLVPAAGDPATEILSAASSMGADVIVVGRNAHLAPHLIRGSLSGTLVRKAASDVLVVH